MAQQRKFYDLAKIQAIEKDPLKPWRESFSWKMKKASGLPRGTFNVEAAQKIQKQIKNKVGPEDWCFRTRNPNNPQPPRSLREQEKFIKGLAIHLSGETIKDAAYVAGIPHFEDLARFKLKFLKNTPDFPLFLENLFLQEATRSIQIFGKKADEMSPMQAATVAGIFTDKAIQLRKGRQNDFKPDTPPPSVTLIQQLKMTVEKVNSFRNKKGQVIEAEIIEDETKALPDRE